MSLLNANKTMYTSCVSLILSLGLLGTACQTDKYSSSQDTGSEITINWQVDEVINEEVSAPTSGHFNRVIHVTENEVQSSQSYTFILKKSLDELDQVVLLQGSNILLSAAGYQSSLVGLCLNQHNLSPVFFIHSMDEGIGMDYQHLWALDPQQQWHVIALSASSTFMADNIVCADQQYSDWTDYQRHPNSQPCRCDFKDDIFVPTEQERWLALLPEHINIAEPFADELIKNQVMPLTLHLIEDQQAINLMIEHALLDPEYESSVITATSNRFVNLVNTQGFYHNMGYSFLQKQGLWYLWTIAGESSKGFHPITDIQQLSNGRLQLRMCVTDCTWWGEYAILEVDLQQLSLRLLEDQ